MADEQANNNPLESYTKPIEAVVMFDGITTYTAEIWITRVPAMRVQDNKICTYWIYVTDNNFAGRSIKDTIEDSSAKLDILFSDGLNVNLKGFAFRHMAGNIFRVKFRMDMNTGKIEFQSIAIDM